MLKRGEEGNRECMKRSGFKNKIGKPLKRSRLKKKSKMKISLLQRKIWELCKQIIRLRYAPNCYTCPAMGLIGSNCHTGHLQAKASLGAFLKYDLRVLRIQCYICNIFYGGAGSIFIENMRRIEGNKYVDQILKDRQVTVNAYDHYTKIYEEYKKELSTLQNNNSQV